MMYVLVFKFFVASVRLLPGGVFASAFPRTGRPLRLTDVCESACKGTKNGDYKAAKPLLFFMAHAALPRLRHGKNFTEN